MGFWTPSTLPAGTVDPFLHGDIYTDLLTFTFCGPTPYNQSQPLYIDAEDPSRSFTAIQFRQLVRTLIAGFKAHNVQQGDCVLVHLGNSVSCVDKITNPALEIQINPANQSPPLTRAAFS